MKRNRIALFSLAAALTLGAFTYPLWAQQAATFWQVFVKNNIEITPGTTTGPLPLSILDPAGATVMSVDANGNLSAASVHATTAATNGYAFLDPTACGFAAATTAIASQTIAPVATGNLVRTATTNTTAGTLEVVCDVNLASQLASGYGRTITGVSLLYGIQTTAMASIANPTIQTVTYASPGGTAKGTVASAGGSLTLTPGTLQLGTTTSGQFYTENISFGTPVALTSDLTNLSLDQVFTTAGTTATTLQLGGVMVYFNQY